MTIFVCCEVYMDITVHMKMMVLALRDMELRLNSLFLCSEADSEKELRRQRYMPGYVMPASETQIR